MSARDHVGTYALHLTATVRGVTAATADASAVMALGVVLDRFRVAAVALANKGPGQRAGDLFEWIVTAKFNAEAERLGSDLLASLTRELGLPHAAEDVVVRQNNITLQKIQTKVYHDLGALTRKLADPKYRGMAKLVPEDLVEAVRTQAQNRAAYYAKLNDPRAIDHADTAQRISGVIEVGPVCGSGTSLRETEFAAQYPDAYAAGIEVGYLSQAAATSGANGAVAGGLLGGSVAFVRHVWNAACEGGSFDEALGKTCSDAFASGARSGLTAVSATVLRHGAERLGNKVLARADVAAGTAGGLLEAGATALAYVRGEISADEASERFTLTACGTLSNIFVGAAAGAVFGPAGATIGAVVGCLLATEVCTACLAIARGARLATGEALRLEKLYVEATRNLVDLRTEVAQMFRVELERRSMALGEAFERLDVACQTGDADGTMEALTAIVIVHGQSLDLTTFEEFDEFMTRSDEALVL